MQFVSAVLNLRGVLRAAAIISAVGCTVHIAEILLNFLLLTPRCDEHSRDCLRGEIQTAEIISAVGCTTHNAEVKNVVTHSL